MKKFVFALATTLVAGAVFAQANVSGVQGLVTATQGNQLINVTNGATLAEGAQLQLTTGASVTLAFPSGCSVTLGSGQSMLVTNQECLRIAALPKVGGGLLASAFPFSTPVVIGSGVLGLAALREATRTTPTAAPVVTVPVTPTPVTPISPS